MSTTITPTPPSTSDLIRNATDELVISYEEAERLSALVLKRLWAMSERYKRELEHARSGRRERGGEMGEGKS